MYENPRNQQKNNGNLTGSPSWVFSSLDSSKGVGTISDAAPKLRKWFIVKNGFVYLARQLEEWEWWAASITLSVWVKCILRANWKDGKYKGEKIQRGEFTSSNRALADYMGMNVQSMRLHLKRLQKSGCLEAFPTKTHTRYVLVNYDKFQDLKTYLPQDSPHHPPQDSPRDSLHNSPSIERKKERKKEYITPPVSSTSKRKGKPPPSPDVIKVLEAHKGLYRKNLHKDYAGKPDDQHVIAGLLKIQKADEIIERLPSLFFHNWAEKNKCFNIKMFVHLYDDLDPMPKKRKTRPFDA